MAVNWVVRVRVRWLVGSSCIVLWLVMGMLVLTASVMSVNQVVK